MAPGAGGPPAFPPAKEALPPLAVKSGSSNSGPLLELYYFIIFVLKINLVK